MVYLLPGSSSMSIMSLRRELNVATAVCIPALHELKAPISKPIGVIRIMRGMNGLRVIRKEMANMTIVPMNINVQGSRPLRKVMMVTCLAFLPYRGKMRVSTRSNIRLHSLLDSLHD